jgi:hypothetical protein
LEAVGGFHVLPLAINAGDSDLDVIVAALLAFNG